MLAHCTVSGYALSHQNVYCCVVLKYKENKHQNENATLEIHLSSEKGIYLIVYQIITLYKKTYI